MARRRGRLIVACDGDREQVRAAERLLGMAGKIARARLRERRRHRGHLAA
jgi:hypothetical protein